MSVFGDADPEDGYDASDPPPVRLGDLRRWVTHIELVDDERRVARVADALRILHLLRHERVVDNHDLDELEHRLVALE